METKINEYLLGIDELISQKRFPDAIENCFKVIGIVLTDLFHKIFPNLGLDEQLAIINYLKNNYGGKNFPNLFFGAKIKIFIEFKLFKNTTFKFTKETNIETIDEYLKKMIGLIDKRTASAHPEKDIFKELKTSSEGIDKSDSLEIEALTLRFLKIIYGEDIDNNLTNDETHLSNKEDDLLPDYKNIKFNNLPRPIYSKFIGREKYISRIKELFSDSRNFIISIDGIGGVGKTALALETANILWKENKYDAIVWTTAKKNKLEATGIISIVPALSTLEELLNEVIKVFSINDYLRLPLDEKKIKVQELLRQYKTLIIVDNLETIEDEQIFTFLKDELPPQTNVITTTRKKLVEAGRYLDLKEFTEDETRQYIDSVLLEKNVDMNLNDDDINILHKSSGGNPLALRILIGWVIEGFDTKSSLEKIQKGEHKILEFCFEETFEHHLKEDSRKVFVLFPILPEEAIIDEIKVITSLPSEKLNSVLFELERFSLINSRDITKDNKTFKLYSMSPVAKMFAYNKLTGYKEGKYRGLEQDARRKLAEYYSLKEKKYEAMEQYGLALQDVGGQSETGSTAALIANSAMAQYQRGSYENAIELFKKAIKTNPRLSYSYQLWATVERQQGNNTRAEELFKKASGLNPKNAIIWSSWANMKKDEGDLIGAKKILEDGLLYAHTKNNVAILKQQLGVITSKMGNYIEAIEISKNEFIENPTNDERRINTFLLASILESKLKMCTSAADLRNHDEVIKIASEAVEMFKNRRDIIHCNNFKIERQLKKFYRLLGRSYRTIKEYDLAERMFRKALSEDTSENDMKYNVIIELERATNFKFSGKNDKLRKHLEDCYLRYGDKRFKEFK